MSWQKIEEMPCVIEVIAKAQVEIEKLTGRSIGLNVQVFEDAAERNKGILRDLVVDKFKISWQQICSHRRDKKIIDARHAYMYLCCIVLKNTRDSVAKECGSRDHTTVVSAIKKINGFYSTKDPLVSMIEEIKKQMPNEIKIK